MAIDADDCPVTAGHHVWDNEAWFYKFGEWLDYLVGDDFKVVKINGAAPGES